MINIPFFDDRYPVRTVITEKADYQEGADWDVGPYMRYFRDAGKLPIERMVLAKETHSGNVLVIDEADPDGRLEYVDESRTIREAGGFDSVITDLPGILLSIRTADCTPVFLYDTAQGVIAMIHSGWRGAAGAIAAHTIKVMERCFHSKPGNLVGAIGPCICGHCYEVGEELREEFHMRFSEEEMNRIFRPCHHPGLKEESLSGPAASSINGTGHFPDTDHGSSAGRDRRKKYFLDVKEVIRRDLLCAGLARENLYDTGICSYESKNFASYRRDGRMGFWRQTLSGIMLLK